MAEVLRLWEAETHGMLSELRFYLAPEATAEGRQPHDGDVCYCVCVMVCV